MEGNDTFIILGSGCSAGNPTVNHLLNGLRYSNRGRSIQSASISKRMSGSEGLGTEETLSNYGSDSYESERRKMADSCSEKRSDYGTHFVSKTSTSSSSVKENVAQSEFLAHRNLRKSRSYRETERLMRELQAESRCHCREVMSGGLSERNRRNNVSCLVRLAGACADNVTLVDVGKTFRDTMINTMIPLGLTEVDRVLVTHDHADATASLDDLREFIRYEKLSPESGSINMFCVKKLMDLYCSATTSASLLHRQRYMFENEKWTRLADGSVRMPSRWPALKLNEMNDDPYTKKRIIHKFESAGRDLSVEIFPCFHGCDYISLGYGFGNGKVLYLSDVKSLSSNVVTRICASNWDLLVIDAICPMIKHYSHFTLLEALLFAFVVNPRQVRFVGMSCVLEYDETNSVLSKWLRNLEATGENVAGLDGHSPLKIKEAKLGYDGESFSFADLGS